MDIKTIRESLNLTQAELALALEVSRNYVCLLEKGHRLPSEKILHKLKLMSNKNANKSTERANSDVDLSNIIERLEKLEVDVAILKKVLLR